MRSLNGLMISANRSSIAMATLLLAAIDGRRIASCAAKRSWLYADIPRHRACRAHSFSGLFKNLLCKPLGFFEKSFFLAKLARGNIPEFSCKVNSNKHEQYPEVDEISRKARFKAQPFQLKRIKDPE
jgi:hypothetical protein